MEANKASMEKNMEANKASMEKNMEANKASTDEMMKLLEEKAAVPHRKDGRTSFAFPARSLRHQGHVEQTPVVCFQASIHNDKVANLSRCYP